MEVNSIGTNGVNKIADAKPEKQNMQKDEIQASKQQQTITQTDKLEISDEAKRMQTIENRLKSGFYDNEEVQRATAQNIYRKIFEE